MQKILIIIGIVIVIIGLTWPWLSTLPFGRLPGDIIYKKDNVSFYFPITTMIVVSIVITFIGWLFRQF
ncbi:MAG: DUF2905 domain-containing protein [Pseudomonadales bacterium]|nr:DUF2905 domain-containing protein [Pseudomonadales bacterium]